MSKGVTMPIKVKIKTHIDIAGKIVPVYMRNSEFVVVDYPDNENTTIMYSDSYVYTFRNQDIELA